MGKELGASFGTEDILQLTASKKLSPQSCSHKERNPANDLNGLGGRFFPS